MLFVDGTPAGVIEAKKAEEGFRLSMVEEQTVRYGEAKLRYLGAQTLPFLFEANGEVIHFTDRRDPRPKARELFAFPRPQVLANAEKRTLRRRLKEDFPTLEERGLRPAQVVAIRNLETSLATIRGARAAGSCLVACSAAPVSSSRWRRARGRRIRRQRLSIVC